MHIPRILTAVAATPLLATSGAILVAPAAHAATPADNRAYVSSLNDGSVTVYDTTSRSVVTTITGASRPSGMALSPDGTEIYTATLESSDRTVKVIDTAANTVVASLPMTGGTPRDVVFSPDGDTAYVMVFGTPGRVNVIDTATRTVTSTIPLPGNLVHNIAISPDGSALYVSEYGNGTNGKVHVVDPTDGSVVTVPGFQGPEGLAVSPDGSQVYVADYTAGTIEVINTATNSHAETIAVSGSPEAVAFSPDGSRAYTGTQSLIAIDTSTGEAEDLGTAGFLTDVKVASDGATVYAIDLSNNGRLLAFDAATSAMTVVGPTGLFPFEIALGPTFVPEADLGVSLDANAPALGSRIDYALTLTNNGPDNTTAATVQVSLPSSTTSVTNLPTGCTYASGTDTVTCTVGAIANGGDTTRAFRANLGLLSLGPLPATATRTTSTPTDPNPTNDTSNASCTALTSLIITC